MRSSGRLIGTTSEPCTVSVLDCTIRWCSTGLAGVQKVVPASGDAFLTLPLIAFLQIAPSAHVAPWISLSHLGLNTKEYCHLNQCGGAYGELMRAAW